MRDSKEQGEFTNIRGKVRGNAVDEDGLRKSPCFMASITTLRRGGKIIGFQTENGKDQNGKPIRKFHKTYDEAQAFNRSSKIDNLGTGELFAKRHELIVWLNRARELNLSIGDALEFCAKHGAGTSNRTLASVVSEFIADKRQVGRGEGYMAGLKFTFDPFLKEVGTGILIGDVTADQIKNYVYVKHNDWGAVTKTNNLRMLSLVFNYGIKKKYIAFNPTAEIDRPKKKFEAPKVLTPDAFSILLNRCLKKKWYDRLTVFVLVGFCGLRLEESSKIKWSDIDMENGKVMVSADIAKKAAFRRNVIPPNAMKWLRAVYDARRTGPIIGTNWKNLIRSAVRFSHIDCPKNGIRHSFCSYALETGMPLAECVAMMGHNGSPAMINSHYRNIVEPKEAKKWWAIVPNQAASSQT